MYHEALIMSIRIADTKLPTEQREANHMRVQRVQPGTVRLVAGWNW